MSHLPIEQTKVYEEAKSLANQVWFRVRQWESFARWSVGRQLCECLDSVGANLAEGDGRYSDGDAIHFFVIARGSLREAGYWIDVSGDRELLDIGTSIELKTKVESIRRKVNGLINYRRSTKNTNLVKEETAGYGDGAATGIHARRLTPDAPLSEELQFNEG